MSAHLGATVGTSVYSQYELTMEEDYIYLSICYYLSIVSRYTNWHDCNAFRLPNSTAKCEIIAMTHQHENDMSRFSVLCGLWGARAACAEVLTGSVGASNASLGLRSHIW
jgi:hypothetical protein